MKSRSEFVDAYQWTKTINMSSILLNIQFQIVDYLQLIYRLKSDLSICIIQEEKSYYDKNQMIFYIHQEWIEQSKHYRDIFHSFARIFIPNYNHQLIRLLANFINLLYNEEENNLEIFAKYQQFDLEFKDLNDSPWQISSTLKPIQYVQPKIGKKKNFFFSEKKIIYLDENKVRTLLENVAQNQEQYNTYKQKKRQEFQKHLSVDSSTDSILRFDNIHSDTFSSTTYENVEQHTKHFNIEDLTHQVLDNRDSTIGSDQKLLEKIGRWGKNSFIYSKFCNSFFR
jgi:hypothetical protein